MTTIGPTSSRRRESLTVPSGRPPALPALDGLTESEVAARISAGQANGFRVPTSRSYFHIVRHNALTFINTVLFGIAITLLVLRRGDDALSVAGLILFSVFVGMFQEIRAKHRLDAISVLACPTVSVVRSGREYPVPIDHVVLGDVVLARPGDQIVADGEVVSDGTMEVDESLLTGESDLVSKKAGDTVYSGTLCLGGAGSYITRKVGKESTANDLTVRARDFRRVKTMLQRDVDTIVRIMVAVSTILILLFAFWAHVHGVPMVERVQMAAVIVALVPQGLLVMTTVSYALGAARMAGKGVLIQQPNAVESLSHVDVLCLDKTGTLTTNSLRLDHVYTFGEEATVNALLGAYVRSVTTPNRTLEAIAERFPGDRVSLRDEVPFSSERKWGAIVFDDAKCPRACILGAPEVLEPYLAAGSDVQPKINAWTRKGLRTVLFTWSKGGTPIRDAQCCPRLPEGLLPLALLGFSDELRREARETLKGFAEAGMQLKIISGDNPDTVAELAKQSGFVQEIRAVSGQDIDRLSDIELARTVEDGTIFGRVTPRQKERLVRALQQNGHYVGMIGDGVNDVLALKQAQLSIAVEGGSPATRSLADIILLRNSFVALPLVLREGQRIVQGMLNIMRLLLTRTGYVLLVVTGAAITGAPFPITPKHNFVVALLTVGVPTVALAVWAMPRVLRHGAFRSIAHFMIPASVSVSIAGLVIYLAYLQLTGDLRLARTVMTALFIVCGAALIVEVEPVRSPNGTGRNQDWRPVILAFIMVALFAGLLAISPLRAFFGLTPLGLRDVAVLVAVAATCLGALQFVWRARVVERWLGLRPDAWVEVE